MADQEKCGEAGVLGQAGESVDMAAVRAMAAQRLVEIRSEIERTGQADTLEMAACMLLQSKTGFFGVDLCRSLIPTRVISAAHASQRAGKTMLVVATEEELDEAVALRGSYKRLLGEAQEQMDDAGRMMRHEANAVWSSAAHQYPHVSRSEVSTPASGGKNAGQNRRGKKARAAGPVK